MQWSEKCRFQASTSVPQFSYDIGPRTEYERFHYFSCTKLQMYGERNRTRSYYYCLGISPIFRSRPSSRFEERPKKNGRFLALVSERMDIGWWLRSIFQNVIQNFGTARELMYLSEITWAFWDPLSKIIAWLNLAIVSECHKLSATVDPWNTVPRWNKVFQGSVLCSVPNFSIHHFSSSLFLEAFLRREKNIESGIPNPKTFLFVSPSWICLCKWNFGDQIISVRSFRKLPSSDVHSSHVLVLIDDRKLRGENEQTFN